MLLSLVTERLLAHVPLDRTPLRLEGPAMHARLDRILRVARCRVRSVNPEHTLRTVRWVLVWNVQLERRLRRVDTLNVMTARPALFHWQALQSARSVAPEDIPRRGHPLVGRARRAPHRKPVQGNAMRVDREPTQTRTPRQSARSAISERIPT